MDKDTAFLSVSEKASRLTGGLGILVRRALYERCFRICGHGCTIHTGAIFSKLDLRLGDRVYIGSYCLIGTARIGSNTLIADMVNIPSGRRQHGRGTSAGAFRDSRGEYETVTIGEDCWIGSGAVVMAGVGDNSVVGAGAIVVADIPGRSVAVGNPARVIRVRGESAEVQSVAG